MLTAATGKAVSEQVAGRFHFKRLVCAAMCFHGDGVCEEITSGLPRNLTGCKQMKKFLENHSFFPIIKNMNLDEYGVDGDCSDREYVDGYI